jgi:hypothetical protein
MRQYLALLLIVSALIAGCGGGSNAGGGGGGGGGELPAGSTVIFGTSYDPTGLGVTGRATSLKTGTPMVAVGRSFAARPAAQVTVHVTSGSNQFPARPVAASNNPASADIFATDLTADKLGPGTWQIEFIDGEKVIASGFLTVTP